VSESEWAEVLADLAERRSAGQAMGTAERLEKHRGAGKLNARDRIDELCDAGSFTEIGVLVGQVPSDAFVAGVGLINGRPAAVGAEDFTVMGGSIGPGASSKRYRLAELALQERMPLVMLLEGAGHRPPMPGDAPGRRSPNDLQAQADNSGRVPMVAGVMGPSAGHGALTAPLSDFTVMTQAASIFTAGPPLVKASIGEDVDKDELGGPQVALASGVIHNLAADDVSAIAEIRHWLSFLPSSAWERPPVTEALDGPRLVPELYNLVPRNPRQSYDMAQVIEVVVDAGSWFEVQPVFGPSMLTGFARMGGVPVAIVANQPNALAGSIDCDAADKAAHFVQVADAFHLPLLFLTDNPGVMAGTASERAGILRHAGRMFAAQHQVTVPKYQVTLRKAYGFGSTAMSMNPCDNQSLNLAFPGVTFGAMPSRGADDATHATDEEREGLREAELASGYRSAEGLSVDDLIDPQDTRNLLLAGLTMSTARLRGPVVPKARTGILR
jgi:acetyl-CoA carboxylase carboxyltransferase component